MSLELKLQEDGSSDNFQLPGGDLQGFVCFTWTSPFHKYVDYCNLISKSFLMLPSYFIIYIRVLRASACGAVQGTDLEMLFLFLSSEIQVTLEGYLVTNPSNKLSSGKKFYSSEILCVRGELLPHPHVSLAMAFGFSVLTRLSINWLSVVSVWLNFRYLWREAAGWSVPQAFVCFSFLGEAKSSEKHDAVLPVGQDDECGLPLEDSRRVARPRPAKIARSSVHFLQSPTAVQN